MNMILDDWSTTLDLPNEEIRDVPPGYNPDLDAIREQSRKNREEGDRLIREFEERMQAAN